jgi:hypothetical protein
MGGQIGLESNEGQGTCAWFSIPFKKALEQVPERGRSPLLERPTIREEPRVASAGSGAPIPFSSNVVDDVTPKPPGLLQRPPEGVWVLVAEDNKVNQQIALKTLRNMNLNVEAVDNGKEVLAALNRRMYDLILMDCQVSTRMFC